MGFFFKESAEEKIAKQKQKEAVVALEQGDITPQARSRILKEKEYGKNFFSSDLSAREFLLTKEAGFQTLGQVMGTSFYRISFFGFFTGFVSYTGELDKVTHAISEARKMAVRRMIIEAKLLGATGIIGVKVQQKGHSWAENLTEFTAIGTAIFIPEWHRQANEEPFASTLNGQEFWQLYKAGYRPDGIVMGACSYYMHMDAQVRQIMYQWFGGTNQEIPTFSQGYKQAMKIANMRLKNELAEHNADGVVDVSIESHLEHIEYESNKVSYHDLLLNFVMLGTAVTEFKHEKTEKQSPLICLNLANRSWQDISSIDNVSYYENPIDDTYIDDLDDEED